MYFQMEAVFVLFNILLLFSTAKASTEIYLQRELTVLVEPGKTDCFYANVLKKQVIDIEYQVIDGGNGDLDISFSLLDPTGETRVNEFKQADNIHRVHTKLEGDHKFCFDNSFSMFNSKTVFFEIIVEWEEDGIHPKSNEWGREVLDNVEPEQVLNEKFDDMQATVMHLHGNLNRLKHDLDVRRSTEARDRNLSEWNNAYVGKWAMFQIAVMLIVGGIQVFMLRSLFETDPRHNIWKKYTILK